MLVCVVEILICYWSNAAETVSGDVDLYPGMNRWNPRYVKTSLVIVGHKSIAGQPGESIKPMLQNWRQFEERWQTEQLR